MNIEKPKIKIERYTKKSDSVEHFVSLIKWFSIGIILLFVFLILFLSSTNKQNNNINNNVTINRLK